MIRCNAKFSVAPHKITYYSSIIYILHKFHVSSSIEFNSRYFEIGTVAELETLMLTEFSQVYWINLKDSWSYFFKIIYWNFRCNLIDFRLAIHNDHNMRQRLLNRLGLSVRLEPYENILSAACDCDTESWRCPESHFVYKILWTCSISAFIPVGKKR
jgi:hypothetical protein